jgi:hypothetical protein
MGDSTLAQLQTQIDELKHQLGIQQDVQAIRKLHFTYGYFMDKFMFDEIVDLFAEDATLYFLNGIFRGKAGARRLYGSASGLRGPSRGMLFEHIISQDVIDISEDRMRAWGRFRCSLQAAIHDSKKDAPPSIPRQFIEGGIYENEYVKVDGVWKIKTFNYRITFQARPEAGIPAAAGLLMVSDYAGTYPDLPRGPDELRESPAVWPETFVMPFHYVHPVTGRKLP